jgi:nucleotide-binding universal stress UspA family protein
MYDRVICAIGLGSRDRARQLVDTAHDLLTPGGELHLVHVVEGFPAVSADRPEPRAVEMLADADSKLCEISHELPTKPIIHVRTGQAARTILEIARETDADCIVLAAHRLDILDKFFGSTVDRVAQKARCSVHICRPREWKNRETGK